MEKTEKVFMSYKRIKDELLELLYNDKQEELIKKLKNYSNDKKEYQEQSEEYFKYAWNARGCNGKSYYVSNHGHVILTDEIADMEKINKKYLDENEQNYCPIKSNNGYLTQEGLPDQLKNITLYTDIYVFVAEAFKEEFADEIKRLKEKFSNERLELHHINNDPNDNKLNNLIYLPRSIHARAHKYID